MGRHVKGLTGLFIVAFVVIVIGQNYQAVMNWIESLLN